MAIQRKLAETSIEYGTIVLATASIGWLVSNVGVDHFGFPSFLSSGDYASLTVAAGLTAKVIKDFFPDTKLWFDSASIHRRIPFSNVFEHTLTSAKLTVQSRHIVLKENPIYILRQGRKPRRAWREQDLKNFLHIAWRRQMQNQKPGGLTRTYWTKKATVPMLRSEYDDIMLFLVSYNIVVGRGNKKASGRLAGPPEYCLDILRKCFGHV